MPGFLNPTSTLSSQQSSSSTDHASSRCTTLSSCHSLNSLSRSTTPSLASVPNGPRSATALPVSVPKRKRNHKTTTHGDNSGNLVSSKPTTKLPKGLGMLGQPISRQSAERKTMPLLDSPQDAYEYSSTSSSQQSLSSVCSSTGRTSSRCTPLSSCHSGLSPSTTHSVPSLLQHASVPNEPRSATVPCASVPNRNYKPTTNLPKGTGMPPLDSPQDAYEYAVRNQQGSPQDAYESAARGWIQRHVRA